MTHQSSKIIMATRYFIAFIAFLQVWNHWGEKTLLAYFFLIGGIGLLLLSSYELWKHKRNHKTMEDSKGITENGD